MFCQRITSGLLCLFMICRYSYGKANKNFHQVDEKEECDVSSGDFTAKDAPKPQLSHIFKEYAAGLSFRKDIAKMDRASGADIHEVIFTVQQKNLHELEEILNDVADVESANYGQYLTREEIADLTYDSKSHVAILQYLKDIGATVVAESMHGEYVTAHAPVSVWETVFHTEFFTFHHSRKDGESPIKIVRAEKYYIPLDLHPHVASVFHTIQMPMAIWGAPIVERKSKVSNSSSIRGQVLLTGRTTLALLNNIYNIDSNIGNSLSSQAAFETIGQYFNEKDLSIFQTMNSLPNQPVTTKIGGHIDDTNTICSKDFRTCMEANMDIQYLMSISQVSPTTHWYTGENSFAAWLLAVANYRDPPLVFSISFGAPESTVTFSEFEAFNLQAVKLGLMGITIVAASGDDGASSFLARNNPSVCGYSPLFPATSPYVTTVGGTQGPESGTAARVCQSDAGSSITSGGGFSTRYSQPTWQSGAVSAYFSTIFQTSKTPYIGYNSSGRGIPDISAQSTRYEVVIGGNTRTISGTSASAPVIAGMISLVNAARLAAGKSSVGWFNPILYAYYQSFTNDITEGKNNCVAQSSLPCCPQGFSATPGWDPTTGWGTVDFSRFKAFMSGINITRNPTVKPTASPTKAPTAKPTQNPTSKPTIRSSQAPTRRIKLRPGRDA